MRGKQDLVWKSSFAFDMSLLCLNLIENRRERQKEREIADVFTGYHI